MTTPFHVDGRSYWLEPDSPAAGPAPRPVRLCPAVAAALVERHFYGETGTIRLRALVGARRYAVQHWTDHEVRAEAARLVAGGAWTVWSAPGGVTARRASGAGAGASASSSGAAAPAPARAPAPRPPSRPAAPASTPASGAAAEPDWPAQASQDAFAAVLEDGARTGVPFCEICA
jgi:hypothetical protein